MTLGDLKNSLAVSYGLETAILDRLVLRRDMGKTRDGKSKYKYIVDNDAKLPTPDALLLGGYQLMVRYAKGDEREEDTTCDSKFMEKIMPLVGRAIRNAHHWVSFSTPIFLYLDNAGGHGTKDVVDQYVADLRKIWNVICVHQRPRSPATNMLDLGIWMAFQNVVEKMHVGKRMELSALCSTVEDAWGELDPVKLQNVYTRWKMVLDLIIEDDGGDRLVEARRGKLYREPSAEELEDGDAADDDSSAVPEDDMDL